MQQKRRRRNCPDSKRRCKCWTCLPGHQSISKVGKRPKQFYRVQSENQIDLLIAGALEHESLHRNFTVMSPQVAGSGALRSLAYFVAPEEQAVQPAPGVLFAIPDFSPFSRETFLRSTEFAEKIGAQEVTLLHVQSTFAEAKEKALGNELPAVEDALTEWIGDRQTGVSLDSRSVRGNTGFTACEFIQSSEANLLVLPSHVGHPNLPVFAPVLDWIIQVIPTNLWVMRRSAPPSRCKPIVLPPPPSLRRGRPCSCFRLRQRPGCGARLACEADLEKLDGNIEHGLRRTGCPRRSPGQAQDKISRRVRKGRQDSELQRHREHGGWRQRLGKS